MSASAAPQFAKILMWGQPPLRQAQGRLLAVRSSEARQSLSTQTTRPSFQFSRDKEFLRPIVILDAKNIRLATDLTIFDITLAASSGFVHGGRIPFSARGALEARFQRWDTISQRLG